MGAVTETSGSRGYDYESDIASLGHGDSRSPFVAAIAPRWSDSILRARLAYYFLISDNKETRMT